MKLLSSLIVGVGLLVPSAGVLASEPAKAAKPAAAPAGKAPGQAASGQKSQAQASGSPKGSPAKPAAPAVALEPDGVAFGMSADDVAKLYDRWWDKQFIPLYQKANPGPKTRELDFDLAEKKKVLRRVAIFDGRISSFNKAEFKEEFAHGSDETMTSSKLLRYPPGAPKDAKGTAYTRRFFFFQDKLWKIYDEYPLDAASPFGADFKEAASRVEASLQGAKRTRGPESQFENVTFDAGQSRVRVVKLGPDRVAIVRSDTALTQAVLDRRAQQAQTPEAPELDEDIQAVIR